MIVRALQLALLAAVAASAAPGAAPALAASGIVFEDLDGDGVRRDGEPGVPGVVVSRGAVLVESDGDGRYELPDPAAGAATDFIVLTRPADYDCERWYRVDPGDFALRRRTADGDQFVFAHISDAHISDRVSDYAEFAVPGAIMAMPRWLRGTSLQLMMRTQNPDYSSTDVSTAMRAALAEYRDPSRLGDASVMGEWAALLAAMKERDGTAPEPPPIDPAGDFAASLAELRDLAPRFVVSTGDLVLESNKAGAAEVDRWMRFYREGVAATGLRFYQTIGNNEIAGSGNDDFGPGDPGYGKALFRSHFGPTYYSFDRGALHFVALDTHQLLDAASEDWSISSLDDSERDWLLADLEQHAGRTVVVLNHEPLAGDPDWSAAIRWFATVDSDVTKRLEKRGVAYTLSGHVHVNGLSERGPTQHITTGAFSGMRWSFPQAVVDRGYRLVQVHGGELYSVWKSTGSPLLAFLSPKPNRSSFPTMPRRAAGALRDRIVVAAADVAGPFVSLDVRLDGVPLALEHWSRYFVASELDRASLAAGKHVLVAEARRADGSVLRVRTTIRIGER